MYDAHKMARPGQIRGMLLEEAILHLLRKGGYRTVQNVGSDMTLALSGAGICVKSRGGKHQIDAIADFLIYQPFSKNLEIRYASQLCV
jgi:hypothetical protein